jgi:hypothetical protein
MRNGIAILAALLAVQTAVVLPLRTRLAPLPMRAVTSRSELAGALEPGGVAAGAADVPDLRVASAHVRRASAPGIGAATLEAGVFGGGVLAAYAPALDARSPDAERAPLEVSTVEWVPSLTLAPIEAQVPSFPAARPRALPALYVSFATLQVVDAVSTWRVVRRGDGRELNPILTGVADNLPALLAIKAASTAVSVYAVEKLHPRNRKAALATMIAVNVAYAYVVANNLGVSRTGVDTRRRSPNSDP